MKANDIKDKSAIVAKKDDVHAEAIRRFEMCTDAGQRERELALEDARFAQTSEGQWDDIASTARKDRPRYTINKVAGAIDTVVGDQRQHEIAVKVRPMSSGATKPIADTFNGLIKNIEEVSSARNIYDNGFDEILNSGFGGWRVVTEYSDEDTFEQDIRIKPINSAASSLWFDPSCQEYDCRDALYAFLTIDISRDIFKAKYPNHTEIEFPQFEHSLGTQYRCWFGDNNTIKIAEYWRKVPITQELVLLSDNTVVTAEKYDKIKDDMQPTGSPSPQGGIIPQSGSPGFPAPLPGVPGPPPKAAITEVKRRTVDTWKIERYVLNGAELLQGPENWAGRYIPLIPAFGKISYIEDQKHVRGLVRFAKDPQRIYNYARSNIVETAALAPKDPYWMTPKQAQGHEGKLSRMNTDNSPIQFYNADAQAPGPPARTGAPQVQQAQIEVATQANIDIRDTTGVTPSAAAHHQAQTVDRRSGEAIKRAGERSDVGSYIFFDNMRRSIEYTGLVMVDLIPMIYDTERQVRTLAPDGTAKLQSVNQTVIDVETGEEVILNDLSQGKYDVAVDTGPAFATKRVEAAEQLIQLSTEQPMFSTYTPDLIAKNLDLPGSTELHDRVRKAMIEQGLVQPTPEEVQELGLDKPKQPSKEEQLQLKQLAAQVILIEAQSAQLFAQAEKMKSDGELSLAKVDNTELDSNKKAVEALGTQIDNIKKQLEIGLPVGEQGHDIRIGQQDLVEVTQEMVQPGGTSEELQNNLVNQALQSQGQPRAPSLMPTEPELPQIPQKPQGAQQ